MKIAILLTCAIVLLFAAIKCFSKRKKKFEKAILKCRLFLFLKGEEQKLLNDYLSKIENNMPRVYDSYVNYQMLKDAGLFLGKQVLKISLARFSILEKQQLVALSRFNSKNEYSVFVLVENKLKDKVEKFIKDKALAGLKFIEKESVNPKLIFELNKLNLNYDPTAEEVLEGVFLDGVKIDDYRYKNKRLKSSFIKENVQINCYKIIFNAEKNNIFNLNNLKILEIIDCNNLNKIKYVKKLSSPFVIGQKNGNEIELKYLEKTEKIYFSHNNFDFSIKKHQKNVFLVVKFKKFNKNTQLNSVMCICSSDKVIVKRQELANLLLQNHIKLEKFFKIDFKSENEQLNKFINEQLPDIVCKNLLFDWASKKDEEILSLNFLKSRKTKSLTFIQTLLSEVLGIKIVDDKLYLSPKTFVPNFEFTLENKIIKFQRNLEKRFVLLSGREFVNLSCLNFRKVKDNEITFCG